jgi:hypothetical protein
VGYLVTPVLFYQFDDRAIAGLLAGKMFTLVSYIGLGAGILLLVGQLVRYGRPSRQHWHGGLLLLMLILVCVGEFILQPQMAALKQAGLTGEVQAQFARLHGIASIVYLLNSVLGLVLVSRLFRNGK